MFSRNAEGGCVVPSVLKSLAGVVCIPALSLLAAPDFYVSPTGNDGASGTSPREPLATIQKAQEKVRAVNSNMTEDIHVNLMGGTYQLTETINFGTADGGSNGHYVVYQAHEDQKPVLSGGVRITGWTEVADKPGVYKADISSYGFHEKGFRQLYVDGVRCIRAREPNLHPRDIQDVHLGHPQNDFYRILNWRFAAKRITVKKEDISGIADWEGIEFIPLLTWQTNHIWIASTEPAGDNKTDLKLHPDHEFIFTRKCPPRVAGQRYYFENAYQFLDMEGEFFVDNGAKVVYYSPRPSEDITSSMIMAPRLDTLVSVKGTLDNPVRKVKFEGLCFEYSTWMKPSMDGHMPIQTELPQGVHLDLGTDEFNTIERTTAAVYCESAQRIDFVENVFRHLGATGIDMNFGVDTCRIIGNVFYDISAMGMCLGEFSDTTMEIHWVYNPDDKRRVTDNITVKNNYIHRVGQAYHGGCGISAGYPRGLRIEHNELYDFPYTGISIGWGWRTHLTPSSNNITRANKLHNVMNFLQDGGGIYTLGNQPNSLIDSNAIYNMRKYSNEYGLFYNIYLDEGSSNMICAHNYIDSTDNFKEIVRVNQGGTLVIKNNGPDVANVIMENAGIEDKYAYITQEDYYKRVDVIHGRSRSTTTGFRQTPFVLRGNTLTISSASDAPHGIKVLAIDGSVVKQFQGQGRQQYAFDFSIIPSGVFVVEYSESGHIVSKQFNVLH